MNKKMPILALFFLSITFSIDPIKQKLKFHQNRQKTAIDPLLEKQLHEWSGNFAHVIHIAKEKHFKINNIESSMSKSINSFLNELDPYSAYLEPKGYQSILETTHGEFCGIGTYLDNTRSKQDKYLTVIETIPDGPADKAGVEAMDKIVEINGTLLEDMTTEEAISLLKGPRGSSVTILVMRTGQPELLSFSIIRDTVKEENTLAFYLPEHNIYYVSLTIFSENATEQIKQLLQKAAQKKYKALILDLRNNSGGLFNVAIDISNLFLEKNSLVAITKDKSGKDIERYYTKNDPVANSTIPIFILTNNYTGSSAEILAGALKVHSQNYALTSPNTKQKLAVFLVGTKTFGKGSVQEIIPVNKNHALKLTTSLYYLPNDTTIQGIGIEPDLIIERTFPPPQQLTWFTQNYGREEAICNHIKITKKENSAKTKKYEKNRKRKSMRQECMPKKKTWADRAHKKLEHDNQIRSTISLINLLDTGYRLCPEQVCNRDKAIEFLKRHHVSHGPLQIEQVSS